MTMHPELLQNTVIVSTNSSSERHSFLRAFNRCADLAIDDMEGALFSVSQFQRDSVGSVGCSVLLAKFSVILFSELKLR